MYKLNIKELERKNKEIIMRVGNSLKGNPNPKIHLNYNIKNAPKPGPITKIGKTISSMNAMKYSGRALRLNKNSLFMQTFNEYFEADGDPLLQEIRHGRFIGELIEFNNSKKVTKQNKKKNVRL